MLAEQRKGPEPMEAAAGVWLEELIPAASPLAEAGPADEPMAAAPPDEAADAAPEPEAPALAPTGNWYVVVDELIDDRVVLVIAMWPRFDTYGRLDFGSHHRGTATIELGPLQEILEHHRGATGQPDPGRDVRIGDTFLVVVDAAPPIGEGVSVGDVESWLESSAILDVTKQAREQAKQALFSAVTPRLTEEVAATLQLSEEEPDPPDDRRQKRAPAGPFATPAI